MSGKTHTNHLIEETSPYLLQHAHNPVDWYPWSDEALQRARQEDKPILLSIGYSACHWCHVMERESFENEDIAHLMNKNFISIKVDREERPDLDTVYMEAVQALTGSGGWPLTVFLTPDCQPFYGGTYFPPGDHHGLPGFSRILQTVASAYHTRRDEVESAAEQLVKHMNQVLEVQPSSEPLAADMLDNAYRMIKSVYDPQNGGFGSAPKFPEPMILEFLLRYHHRSGDKEALSMVEHTLDKMAKGGIYDQVGGGFHRYSIDSQWLVPHFEKMLYDNALLSRLYLHAYQVTGKQTYRLVVEETLDYILREMRDSDGGFYASQDADSEGVEGKYYIWTPDEIIETLGEPNGRLANRYFGITEQGNFEGRNILSRIVDVKTLASAEGITEQDISARIAEAKKRLLEKRVQRVSPHRDEKMLASWNGLMLASFADAASVLGRHDYLEAAISSATFLTRELYKKGQLTHQYRKGQTDNNGYLQDYAFLSLGLLSLYHATFDERWLSTTLELAKVILDQFWDNTRGVFYDTAHSQEVPVIRPRNIYDNALPSGSAAAAFVLIRLARLTDNVDYEEKTITAIRHVKNLMGQYPSGFGYWLCTLDFYLSAPREIVVVGQPEDPAMKQLMSIITSRYLPGVVIAGSNPDESHMDMPLLQGKGMMENKPTVYLCENYACKAPITDPAALANLLQQW